MLGSKVMGKKVNASESTLKKLKTNIWDIHSEKDQKKKDGLNHPFLPNLTYFYEKKLTFYFLSIYYDTNVTRQSVNLFE